MIGIINAYNFMDGINGITACYSLAVLALLFWVNNEVHFIDADFILYCIMAVAVFAFFNFRKKAKCFAGDVGSVSIAFIILFLLGLLMVKTGNVIYVLFLLVYGLDAIWTIVRRLMRKENIFEAHRTHLYQLMANEMGMNRLLISLSYGLLQLVIGCGIIFLSKQSLATQVVISLSVILGFSLIYLVVKKNILQKHLS
jgi:UDP-N-acetylmuramyl pentapeptide phosphotransferase/UDP-N-acetylglucosamine-1-phosphate transferase